MPSFSIAERFRGPPSSGNGGYSCGRVAHFIEGAARVRLHVPPPLNTPIEVQSAPEGVTAIAGETTVATAIAEPLKISVPALPDFKAVQAAEATFRGHTEHFFPGCFVCGTARHRDGGLEIFSGRIADTDLVGATWRPAADLADTQGRLGEEYIWSALDCPGAYSFTPSLGHFILLGELHGEVYAQPCVEQQLAVLGWELNADGRKHRVGTALYETTGKCVAAALATWIEVPGDPQQMLG